MRLPKGMAPSRGLQPRDFPKRGLTPAEYIRMYFQLNAQYLGSSRYADQFKRPTGA